FHSCHNTTIWTILLQERHLAAQSQVVKHAAGHDDVTHLLRSTSGLYTGGFIRLLAKPSGRCLGRTTWSTQSSNPQERTYTASVAVTSVWKGQWLLRLGKGPLPSLEKSWRNLWMGSSPSMRYSTVLQT
ncbi:hypothetical protein NDU88_002406, partial [Pleurodeles waltl]